MSGPGQPQAAHPPGPARAPRILVVDDTPANLDVLGDVLGARGYEVRAFPNGRLALAAALREPPDLVLLDVAMPELDGYEVSARFKAEEKLRGIPIVFLSARNETADLVKGFEAGGVDYVAKPFQAQELWARIHTHLELRRLRAEVEESYARLRELETLRDDLTHMVVHDMRNPLGVVSMALEMLATKAGPALDEKGRRHVESALSGARRLAGMVDDMLDVSRLESGRMPLQLEAVNLRVVVEEAVASLGPVPGGRTVEVAGPPTAVACDRAVVARVVVNLLTNALKFTDQGGRVEVTVSREESRARVAVRDHGPGVPEEARERVFDKFWRAGRPRDQAGPSSMGLGLAFCRLAVEAHGGAISVAPAQGGGSVFSFTLPGVP